MTEEQQLLTKTQLKELRLKPAPGQTPAKKYWSNRAKAWFDLYDPAEAVPMRAYRPPSEKQVAALAHGRFLAMSVECRGCNERFEKWDTEDGWCAPCARAEERESMRSTAKHWLSDDPLFLDVETTGLQGEIIEIAILDKTGTALLDTLVKPLGVIEPGAFGVHGITEAMVASAPTFAVIAAQVRSLIEGRTVIAHNSDFDRGMIYSGFRVLGLEQFQINWRCTMYAMAQMNKGRWPTLGDAMHLAGASWDGLQEAHRAKADAEQCRRIVLTMAGLLEPSEQK